MNWLPAAASALSAIVGAIVGALGAYLAFRKDRRENRTAEALAAAETIRLMEKQITLLERQAEEAKAREARLEARIEMLETWQRDEISARTQLQMCRKSKECTDFDPGFGAVE